MADPVEEALRSMLEQNQSRWMRPTKPVPRDEPEPRYSYRGYTPTDRTSK